MRNNWKYLLLFCISLLDQQRSAFYQARFYKPVSVLGAGGFLPGGVGVARVSELGEGRGERRPPICRENRVDLSGGVKVEQAGSKDAGRLH